MEFRFLEKIGEGGMGCVWKGCDPSGRLVAIKMMSNQLTCFPLYREFFYNEVEALRKMNHPSVVRIVGDVFEDNSGNLYLPMEFVDGINIEKYVLTNGPMSVENAMKLMEKILDAMQYVHEQGCIHRDIKPANIMIRKDWSICIIDFGIAKDARVGGSGHTVGKVTGTDGYMSPEQANGLNVDHRTDIYSLGCLLYFMLVGEHAIAKRENDYKTMAAILNEEMALPSSKIPTISPEIDQVFKKAVDKNMTLRYQTAEEFKEALTHLFPNLAPGGTGIGIQPLLGGGLNPVVTIGSAPDNDIQFVNNYISRHHLKIKGMDIFVGGKQTYSLAVEDNSKNGTFVDGQKLCRDTKVIPYRSTLDLPQIKLPGRPECILNWEEILSILRQRGWVPGDKPLPKDPPVIGWGILCLIIPFVGWILYGVWREKKPKLASKLNILSSIGFSLYIVVLIILLI